MAGIVDCTSILVPLDPLTLVSYTRNRDLTSLAGDVTSVGGNIGNGATSLFGDATSGAASVFTFV